MLERPVVKSAADACPAELADKCVALGISTGGPPALTRLLAELRPPMPPMVIVQHMPPQFTGPLAARLNSISALSVREAGRRRRARAQLRAGSHPAASTWRSCAAATRVRRVDPTTARPVSGHKPSVDVMMTSAAKAFGPNCLGVIMTGMGRDGANGCRAIRQAGGYVLGQDEASSDVYGMNKVAFVEGDVDRQIRLGEAAVAIAGHVRRLGLRRPSCTVVKLPIGNLAWQTPQRRHDTSTSTPRLLRASAGSAVWHGRSSERRAFERYAELIYARTGIRVSPQKKTLLSNRLRRRLRSTGIATFEEYYQHVKSCRPATRNGTPSSRK